MRRLVTAESQPVLFKLMRYKWQQHKLGAQNTHRTCSSYVYYSLNYCIVWYGIYHSMVFKS